MERPGCKWIVSGISLAMAIGFLFGSQCNSLLNGRGQPNPKGQDGQQIAEIGDIKLYDAPLTKLVDSGQAGGRLDPVTSKPVDYPKAYSQALDAEVTHALLLEVAKENGFPLDDSAILKAIDSQFDMSLDQAKMTAMMSKDLAQNATDQQVSDYIKKKYGKTPAELKKANEDAAQETISDPDKRSDLLLQLANDVAMKGFSDSLVVTDDDLKHSQDEYVGKHIVFNPDKHPGEDMEKLANQVLADLKAKKITFEQAMDKYSDESAAAGKKKSDNTSQTDTLTWKTNPDYVQLRNLKVGDISDVIPNKPKGFAIFTLTNIINVPMPDFAKQKDNLRKSYVESLAAAKQTEALKKLRKSNVVKWTVPGWGYLEDWYQATTGDSDFAAKPPAEQHKIEQGFVDEAVKLDDTGAVLTAVGAFDPIWTSATDAEKKTLEGKYQDALSKLLIQFPSFEGRMELAKVAAAKKDKDIVFQCLASAADINEGGVANPQGQVNFSDLAAAVYKYKDQGLISASQDAEIQAKLDSWRDQKLDYDKELAERNKEQAIERQKFMEEKRKAEASKPKPAPPATAPLVGAGVKAPPPSVPGAPVAGAGPPKLTITPSAPAGSAPAPTVKVVPTPVPAKPGGK